MRRISQKVSLFRFGIVSIMGLGICLMGATVHMVSTQKAHAEEISGLKGTVHQMEEVRITAPAPGNWI